MFLRPARLDADDASGSMLQVKPVPAYLNNWKVSAYDSLTAYHPSYRDLEQYNIIRRIPAIPVAIVFRYSAEV